MPRGAGGARGEARPTGPFALAGIVALFVAMAAVFASIPLDIDEFRVVKEPYEMLGGDYTVGYLKAGEGRRAVGSMARAYAFYWKYRPLSSPVIEDRDRERFREEEARFGYRKPEPTGVGSLELYRHRLIVPEPDRFYRHGAGAPLLTAILRIPSLALTRALTLRGPDLLERQFRSRHHPIFVVPRLQGMLAGIACILLVYSILKREKSRESALLGAAILACAPPAIMYFPNLHYDAILAPLVLAASYLFVRDRHLAGGICFGLAMASKNTAVFVLPAAAAFVGVEALRLAGRDGRAEAMRHLRRKGTGLALFTLAGVLSLAPFADPVSQFREILTPVVSRPIDPRGEGASAYSLLGRSRAGAEPQVAERAEVTLMKRVVGYDLSFLFALLGLPLLWPRLQSPFGRYAFCFLLMSFPYRLMFGGGLGYRSLMFLPFFAILAALALERRVLAFIAGLLLAMDLVFLLDPIASAGLRSVTPPPGAVVAPARTAPDAVTPPRGTWSPHGRVAGAGARLAALTSRAPSNPPIVPHVARPDRLRRPPHL